MRLLRKARGLLGLALLSSFAFGSRAQADINFQVNLTCDNVYALYYGTQTAATNFVATNNDWPSTESYTFTLPTNNYIYVACWTDDAGAQGFLAQFKNLDNNTTFYSSDPQWQVTATGINKNTGDPAPVLTDLTTQILLANAGNNPSNGWVATTVGPENGAAPWGTRPNIDAEARWTWYDSGKDNTANPFYPVPFNGFNHDEYLIFRIPVNATPSQVPEPGVVALFGVGLMSAWILMRRRR
jgi:hypothetical protein